MKCVILAAGEGKRMHPLTFTRPKVMLPVNNKPILEWNLINTRAAGLKEFIFIVGYKSEMVRNYFGNGKKWNVGIEYLNQGEPLGTANAVSIVRSFADEFIVLCGDTIFGKEDIKNIAKQENSIGLFKVESPEEYGVVETKGNNVIKIHEKMNNPQTDIINGGIYHFNSTIFNYIDKTKKSPRREYEITDSINMLINKYDVTGILLKEWRDVVYPWHLLDANTEMLKNVEQQIEGTVENNTNIKGEVAIGKKTSILSGSYIVGPVIIGDNCKIGPNCYIRPYTSVGNNCHIGNACEVKNSIIMNNSNVPHQNYIGDSIIGEHCNLGAGTKVANLRLDKKNIKVVLNGKKIDTKRRKLGTIMGDNVQTGINVTINVGTLVGYNVFIGPGATANGEFQSHTMIY